MYHQFVIDPSQTAVNYSDLSLMGSSSSNNNSGSFSHDQELGFNQLQFDPNASTLLRMLAPGNLHDHNGFIGEIPADSVSAAAAAAMFYDPSAATMFHSVLNHGSGGSSLVFEEGYGGQFDERIVQLGSNKRKRAAEESAGGLKNEKQRRERLSKKYDVLKALIPNPTKPDRATIVADTITYIHELLRTVDELKLLVEKKRRRKSGIKKGEIIDNAAGDMESSCMKPLHHDPKGSQLRSAWLQRKSKDTHVDVRIVEDEVFIKITRHKKMEYCLLVVARVLEELELDILHLSGGNIGDLHVFMFSSKIHEGSSVYAGAIAKKIIEAMDAKYPELTVGF